MEEELTDLLEHGKKWEQLKTTVPGIYIKKIPESKSRPACLAVEINPPDESGNPTKKTGVMIRSMKELGVIRELLALENVEEVLHMIEKICPHQVEKKEKVLEI
ncbi:MAG: hypothetical protein RTV72_12240 [Candidatus Thorarchaeota archaeon]